MMPEETQTCSRRMSELGPWKLEEGLDTWRVQPNGDRTCSFCGSMHPDDVLKFIKKMPDLPGAWIGLTDKGYKFYIHRPEIQNALQGAIKFYAQHIPDEAFGNAMNEAFGAVSALNNRRAAGLV